MFRRAIVRPPGRSFPRGITEAGLGEPDVDLALEQHRRYCAALERCGLALTRLPPDDTLPDSAFVEDVAVLTRAGAVITRPGAESRRGEVPAVRTALDGLVRLLGEIQAPGTLDGGDVCEADDRFWIGVSQRTNPEGARQLTALLEGMGLAATTIDIRATPGLLHLKSGLAALGDGRVLAIAALADAEAFRGCEVLRVSAAEAHAANAVRVNDNVLVASGSPTTESALVRAGLATIALDVSEFRKMDGGLSCLSLRF